MQRKSEECEIWMRQLDNTTARNRFWHVEGRTGTVR